MKAGTQMFILLKNGQPWRRPEQCSFLQQGTTMPPTLSRSKREAVIGPPLESTEELLNSLSLPTMMVSSILLIGEENIQPLWHSPAQCDWFANSNRQNDHSTLKGVLAIVQGLLFFAAVHYCHPQTVPSARILNNPTCNVCPAFQKETPSSPSLLRASPLVPETHIGLLKRSTFPTLDHKFTNDIFIKNRVIISRVHV